MNRVILASEFALDDVVRIGEASRIVALDSEQRRCLRAEGKTPLYSLPVKLGMPPIMVTRGKDVLSVPSEPWVYQNWASIDTETTGTGPNARVVEVAVITCRFGLVVDVFSSRVNPGVPIPDEAVAVHGITNEDVKDAPRLEELIPEIRKRLDQCAAVVGYNIVGYDEPVLKAHGLDLGLPVVDIMPLAKEHAVSVSSGTPARYWKSESDRRDREPDDGEDQFSVSTVKWRRVGRHSLERVSRELQVQEPEEGVTCVLHSASWDAILTARIGWALRKWLPWDLRLAEKQLRALAAQQAASMEAFIRQKAAERSSQRVPADERIRQALEQIKQAMREQASFEEWLKGRS